MHQLYCVSTIIFLFFSNVNSKVLQQNSDRNRFKIRNFTFESKQKEENKAKIGHRSRLIGSGLGLKC